MNIFNLASLELQRESKNPDDIPELIDKAVIIRKWLDKHKGVAERILRGDKFYQYGNIIKTVK